MNLLKRMRMLAPAAIAMTVGLGAFALDLPTKKVNGKTCYYYKVGSSETVYGIAAKYGISRDDIIKYNPSAADGLKAGQMLYFPVEDFKTGNTSTSVSQYITHEVKKGETLYGISRQYDVSVEEIVAINPSAKNGVKAGATLSIPNPEYAQAIAAAQSAADAADSAIAEADSADYTDSTTVSDEPAEVRTYTVAVMLPFMLEEEKVSKPANQITDFYRGFLIAADSLSDDRHKYEILTYDTKGSLEHVKNLLRSKPEISRASVIIAPNVQDQLQAVADFGAKNDIYVLNNFVVKDTNYQTNAYVLQTNVTTEHMYERAADAFMSALESYSAIPVILNNTAGKQDKQAFIAIIKKRMAALGIIPMTVDYTGNLHASTITEQLGEPLTTGQSYIFISTSGSLADFNKFAPGLQKHKENLLSSGSNLSLFGYPEWTTFRSDALELMYKLDTTIYSRFYADSNSSNTKGVDAAFKRWYGKSPAEGVPSQALLGFDTGCYIFNALPQNGGDFSNNTSTTWQGVQSTFNFKHEGTDNGQVNESVYIIRFQPGNIVDTEIL